MIFNIVYLKSGNNVQARPTACLPQFSFGFNIPVSRLLKRPPALWFSLLNKVSNAQKQSQARWTFLRAACLVVLLPCFHRSVLPGREDPAPRKHFSLAAFVLLLLIGTFRVQQFCLVSLGKDHDCMLFLLTATRDTTTNTSSVTVPACGF